MNSRWKARPLLGWQWRQARAGIPVVAVAGRLQLSPPRLHEAGIAAAYALADLEPDLRRSIANASPLLRRIGAQIAKEWLG